MFSSLDSWAYLENVSQEALVYSCAGGIQGLVNGEEDPRALALGTLRAGRVGCGNLSVVEMD